MPEAIGYYLDMGVEIVLQLDGLAGGVGHPDEPTALVVVVADGPHPSRVDGRRRYRGAIHCRTALAAPPADSVVSDADFPPHRGG